MMFQGRSLFHKQMMVQQVPYPSFMPLYNRRKLVGGYSYPLIAGSQSALQTDTTLEFEDYWSSKLPEVEFVEADEIEEFEENEDEEEDSCTEEIINNDYKRRAVEYWKSGKKGHYALSTVQHRFKKVKSLPHIRQLL